MDVAVRAAPVFLDRRAPMNYRMPLQQLMRKLSPPGSADRAASVDDFMDTRPDVGHAPSTGRRQAAPTPRQPGSWSESAIELAQGTEIMEFPDDTAADLMDEYFAAPAKRGA
jgi:hypothetical protein